MSADEAAYQTAHIHESKRPNIIVAISVLTTLSTVAIFLRIYVRWSTRLGFQADDYTIFAAGVSIHKTLFRLDLDLKIDNSLGLVCFHLHRYIPPSFFREEYLWLNMVQKLQMDWVSI